MTLLEILSFELQQFSHKYKQQMGVNKLQKHQLSVLVHHYHIALFNSFIRKMKILRTASSTKIQFIILSRERQGEIFSANYQFSYLFKKKDVIKTVF